MVQLFTNNLIILQWCYNICMKATYLCTEFSGASDSFGDSSLHFRTHPRQPSTDQVAVWCKELPQEEHIAIAKLLQTSSAQRAPSVISNLHGWIV